MSTRGHHDHDDLPRPGTCVMWIIALAILFGGVAFLTILSLLLS